eukprot:Opistho-2@67674
MKDYQEQFIHLATECKVLSFGEFKLKSGRISPYFFNAGLFNRGAALAKLGRYYASAIVDSGIEFDVLFGPAYKGIPLAASTAVSLALDHGRDIPYAFNRKEAKDHGEGGNIVGHPLVGRVLIIDDVITAGTAIRESIDIITAAGAQPVGVVLALDRNERGKEGDLTAVQEVTAQFGIPVVSIVALDQITEFIRSSGSDAALLAKIEAYRAEYGPRQ